MKIKNKTQMYELFNRGLFGNRLKTWTVEEYLLSDYKGEVALRYVGLSPGGPCITGLYRHSLLDEYNRLCAAGYEPSRFIVCEGLDESKRVIQGEVALSENHLDLTYTTVKKPMRPALAEETKYASGLTAQVLLQHHMDANSYSDIMDILDTYNDAVVEFTTNSNDIGICPHRNTVVWEVRNY